MFCHREGSQYIVSDELSFDDIGILAEALSNVGIRKYKVTGGEPLLRSDVVDIIRVLKDYGKAEDLSMTTNGFYLGEYIGDLVDAGLNRINISLHTL
ncbi:MAG: radical SAM protein, partial [Sulfolobales archaeon]